MNNFNIIKKIFAFAVFIFCANVHTESIAVSQKSDTKQGTIIVTISGQKVMSESETGKGIQLKLQNGQQKLSIPLQAEEKRIQDIEKKLVLDKEALEKDFAELEKTAKILSTEAREQKTEALRDRALKFEDRKRDLERMIQKFQADARKLENKMSELYQKEMGKLDALVKETIKDLAQKHGWDIVLMEESVVFASPKTSKTSIVIEELDKKAKQQMLAKKQALEKNLEKDVKEVKKDIEEKI